MSRLTYVELRKSVDTRAGLWLLLSLAALALLAACLRGFMGDSDDQSLAAMFRIAGAGPGILLPIVGILAVTSEWSQRTTLTTFVLVPQRWRVVAAKVLAGLAIGAVSVLVCLAAALIAAAVSGAPGGWDLDLRTGLYQALSQMLGILGGTAFGMLFLSSPVAIVAYFALPTVWGVTTELVSALREAGQWLDTSQTFGPLGEAGALSGEQWAQLATSSGLWLLLPLAMGLWRVLRKEIA